MKGIIKRVISPSLTIMIVVESERFLLSQLNEESENGIQLNNKLCQNEKLEMSSGLKQKAANRHWLDSAWAFFRFQLALSLFSNE